MKSLFIYFEFALYMLGSTFKKRKLESLVNQGKNDEAEKFVYDSVKDWAQFIMDKAGVELKIEGKENMPETACLFVANHQGALDIPVMLASIDRTVGFVAKKEMTKFKFLTYWCRHIHCVFMDRQNVREAMKSIEEGANNLKNGHDMLIFPEGTRSKGPELGEFKKGSMKLGTKAGVPIVPVAIEGTYKAREANDGWKFRPAVVRVAFGKPVIPSELSREEQKELAEIMKTKIAESLESMRNN